MGSSVKGNVNKDVMKIPKFDELLFLVDMYTPDVICITESWLSPDIQDSEILIPEYISVRLDRNRHGGGVIMFVSVRFTVKSTVAQ